MRRPAVRHGGRARCGDRLCGTEAERGTETGYATRRSQHARTARRHARTVRGISELRAVALATTLRGLGPRTDGRWPCPQALAGPSLVPGGPGAVEKVLQTARSNRWSTTPMSEALVVYLLREADECRPAVFAGRCQSTGGMALKHVCHDRVSVRGARVLSAIVGHARRWCARAVYGSRERTQARAFRDSQARTQKTMKSGARRMRRR